MNDTEILSEQATIRSMVRGASHQAAPVNLDPKLTDALDAYSQRLKVLSEQATSNNDEDEQICNDLDFVIGRGYLTGFNGRQTHATGRTFSAFEISNAILDILDDGRIVDGLRYGWKFDYPDESRADAERLDFRDLVLARLKR